MLQMSCREEMANHSLIPDGGPKTIDDFLALFNIYEPPTVRRSTMSAISMKQPTTISEQLQMVIPELEGQMYEWVCKQLHSSISRYIIHFLSLATVVNSNIICYNNTTN